MSSRSSSNLNLEFQQSELASDTFTDRPPMPLSIQAARAGERLSKLGDRVDPEDLPARPQPLCVNIAGLGLHAGVAPPARDRQRLEPSPIGRRNFESTLQASSARLVAIQSESLLALTNRSITA